MRSNSYDKRMMKRCVITLATVCLLALAAPQASWADDPETAGIFSLVWENDAFSNQDRHYTNGIKLIWNPGPATAPPRWAAGAAALLPWYSEQGHISQCYTLGQNMFTPSDIKVTNPPPNERPYAGWLYLAYGMGLRSGIHLDQLELNIGMVGPAALAKQSQKLIHELTDSANPRGWDTQLHNEPGLVFTYQHGWRGSAMEVPFGGQLDWTPHVGVTVGNVLTYANAGLTLRYGARLPDEFGPPRIQPAPQGSGYFSNGAGWLWYLFAGVDGRAVARNIFLDGNTFRNSRSVDKETWVGDLQFGLVLEWSAVRLSYTHVLRTREFRTQKKNDNFGAITLAFKI